MITLVISITCEQCSWMQIKLGVWRRHMYCCWCCRRSYSIGYKPTCWYACWMWQIFCFCIYMWGQIIFDRIDWCKIWKWNEMWNFLRCLWYTSFNNLKLIHVVFYLDVKVSKVSNLLMVIQNILKPCHWF